MELIYCLKCKTKTNTTNLNQIETKKEATPTDLRSFERTMLTGLCNICKTKKNKFRSLRHEGKGWTDLPFEMHLPGYNFAGPGTNLKKRLNSDDTPKEHSKPINKIDEIAMKHDICYRDHLTTKERNKICDNKMLSDLKNTKTVGIKEWLDKSIVRNLIGAKKTLGLGALTSDLAEELHKPIVKKFKKRRVIVTGIDKIWAADLIDMQKFSKQNKHYKYLLTVIDIFSKYVWIVPLKTKTGLEVASAFQTILKKGEELRIKYGLMQEKNFTIKM